MIDKLRGTALSLSYIENLLYMEDKDMVRRKTKDGRVLPHGVSERADGRFIYRYKFGGKTHYIYDKDLNELKKKIDKVTVDKYLGMDIDRSNMKLGEWYKQYVATYKSKVKETTLNNYRKYYKWYVEGYPLDTMPVKSLNKTMIVTHFKYLAEEKELSHGTLRSLASMLCSALEEAAADKIISYNPARNIMKTVKAKPEKQKDALTEPEVNLLIDFLKQEGKWQNVYLPLIAIALNTGWRYGEIVGLTWNDIDFDSKFIDINHIIQYRDRGRGHHEFFATSVKTEKSNRLRLMTDEMKYLLEIQREYQKMLRIPNNIAIDGYSDFVFTTKKGYPYTNEAINRMIKDAVKGANAWERERAKKEDREPVEIRNHTMHWYRHTFGTNILGKKEQNILSDKQVLRLMGHSSLRITEDVYGHLDNSADAYNIDLNGIVGVL